MPEFIQVLSGRSTQNNYALSRERAFFVGNTDDCDIIVRDPLCVKPTKSLIEFGDDGWQLKVRSGGPWLIDSKIVSDSTSVRIKENSLIQMSRFGPDLKFLGKAKRSATRPAAKTTNAQPLLNGSGNPASYDNVRSDSQAPNQGRKPLTFSSTMFLACLPLVLTIGYIVFVSSRPAPPSDVDPSDSAQINNLQDLGNTSPGETNQLAKTEDPQKALVWIGKRVTAKGETSNLMAANGIAIRPNVVVCTANVLSDLVPNETFIYCSINKEFVPVTSITIHPKFETEPGYFNIGILKTDEELPHFIDAVAPKSALQLEQGKLQAYSRIGRFMQSFSGEARIHSARNLRIRNLWLYGNNFNDANSTWVLEIEPDTFSGWDGAPVIDAENNVIGIFESQFDSDKEYTSNTIADAYVFSLQLAEEIINE